MNGHQVPAAASAASAFRAAAGNPAPAALRGGGQAAASPATASPTAPDGPARAAPFEPQHAAAADSRDPRLSRCQVDPETEAAALSFLQADVPATGPHRLILFDLETTGEALLCKPHSVPHSKPLAASQPLGNSSLVEHLCYVTPGLAYIWPCQRGFSRLRRAVPI